MYKRFGTETISAFPYIFGAPAIYTCSPEVARQIVSTKGSFYKSEELAAITLYVSSFFLVRLHANQSLSIWGPNMTDSRQSLWKVGKATHLYLTLLSVKHFAWPSHIRPCDRMRGPLSKPAAE